MDAAQVFVAGKKGSGKTTLIQDIVLTYLRETEDTRFVVWDTTGEFLEVPGRVFVFPEWDHCGEEAVEFALTIGRCTFVCDELDKLAPNKGGSALSSLSPGLHEICHRGRHWQVGLLAAGRRPVNVHTDIPSQADALIFFRARAIRDVKWVRDLTDESWARAVQSLDDHAWLRCNL